MQSELSVLIITTEEWMCKQNFNIAAGYGGANVNF